jgi:small subunit ribosomal protein S4e
MNMAKRGQKGHTKRMAAPKAMPIHDKKSKVWIVSTGPGTHPAIKSIPLLVLLREVLGIVQNRREAKAILNGRKVLVDGVARTDEKFPVGLMDVVAMPEAHLYYKMTVKRGKLFAEKATKEDSHAKLLKVTGKRMLKGKKISISLHDGRNLLADNNVKIGDSILMDTAVGGKMKKLLKFGKGAKCIITDGKHSGDHVVVEEVFSNSEGRPAEALVSTKEGSYRTLAQYLFVVGE